MDVILNLAVLSTLWATLEVLKEKKISIWLARNNINRGGDEYKGAGEGVEELIPPGSQWVILHRELCELSSY